MEIKAKDMCPRCKYCLGMTPQGMYSCGKANDGSELNIGIDTVLICANFEWKDEKVEGKVSERCPKCKNCKCETRESNGVHTWLTEVECEDPYDGMVKTLDADSDICCSMFEVRKEKEPFNLNMPREAIKAIAKLNDVICELEKENETLNSKVEVLDKRNTNQFVMIGEKDKEIKNLKEEKEALTHVLYPGEKVCKEYSEILEDIKLLNKGAYDLKEDNKRLAEKNKALFEENLDRLDKHTKQCQEIDNLKNELKKANKLADSWKKDYERLRDQFIYPIYDILYPDNPKRDINVTDVINDVKDLKVYSEENGSMYKEVQEWREKCIARGKDIDHLFSENKEKDKKISELEARRTYWEKKALENAADLQKTKNDRDKWRKLYNSLSEACADYDKRCKEECEKKYRDEISKLQNIVTEKDVEIKRSKKEIINLSFDRATIKDIIKKNAKLNQTISDQEITIKALLITIKEMCKED